MNEIYYYSAQNNAFYPSSLRQEYVNTNSWPDDALQITFEYYQRLMEGQGKGLSILPNEQGLPVLKQPSPPTEEEKILTAKNKKNELIQQSNLTMAPLLYAVELGMETTAETQLLNEWKKYQVLLNRVDTSRPELIDWPLPPL